jgi:DNA-binding response OmpR family regulator
VQQTRMTALRVMLVEDDVSLAALFSEALIDMGFDVCAVESTAAGAQAAAARCQPDLMIVDAQLSEGDGVAAVNEIRLSRPVPYLLITGDPAGLSGLEPDALVLQKPFTEGDLVNAIKRVFAKLG